MKWCLAVIGLARLMAWRRQTTARNMDKILILKGICIFGGIDIGKY